MHTEYRIRQAQPDDITLLPEIERVAALLFKSYPVDLGIPEEVYQQTTSFEAFGVAQQAGRLWVAEAIRTNDLVGFALVVEVNRYAHLDELDVLPQYGMQGIGSSLLEAVCVWARQGGYPAVTLRTFRDVAWNGPFYQRRGFLVVSSSSLSLQHVAIEEHERQRGLRTDLRVTMVYRIL